MRKEFEMTQEDFEELAAACKPVPYIIIGGVMPKSPQENANAAWNKLGTKMGFIGSTARPVPGKGSRFFTAETMEV